MGQQANFCGCCGRELKPPIANYSQAWCVPCQQHLGDPTLAPWDRTYFGQHKIDCPYQVVFNKEEK